MFLYLNFSKCPLRNLPKGHCIYEDLRDQNLVADQCKKCQLQAVFSFFNLPLSPKPFSNFDELFDFAILCCSKHFSLFQHMDSPIMKERYFLDNKSIDFSNEYKRALKHDITNLIITTDAYDSFNHQSQSTSDNRTELVKPSSKYTHYRSLSSWYDSLSNMLHVDGRINPPSYVTFTRSYRSMWSKNLRFKSLMPSPYSEKNTSVKIPIWLSDFFYFSVINTHKNPACSVKQKTAKDFYNSIDHYCSHYDIYKSVVKPFNETQHVHSLELLEYETCFRLINELYSTLSYVKGSIISSKMYTSHYDIHHLTEIAKYFAVCPGVHSRRMLSRFYLNPATIDDIKSTSHFNKETYYGVDEDGIHENSTKHLKMLTEVKSEICRYSYQIYPLLSSYVYYLYKYCSEESMPLLSMQWHLPEDDNLTVSDKNLYDQISKKIYSVMNFYDENPFQKVFSSRVTASECLSYSDPRYHKISQHILEILSRN